MIFFIDGYGLTIFLGQEIQPIIYNDAFGVRFLCMPHKENGAFISIWETAVIVVVSFCGLVEILERYG